MVSVSVLGIQSEMMVDFFFFSPIVNAKSYPERENPRLDWRHVHKVNVQITEGFKRIRKPILPEHTAGFRMNIEVFCFFLYVHFGCTERMVLQAPCKLTGGPFHS